MAIKPFRTYGKYSLMSTIIYVHGFNSSGQSHKAKQFKHYLDERQLDIKYLTPDLPYEPAKAISQLEQLIESLLPNTITLIGSSLGGYYSIYLTEKYQKVKTVLINPAIRAYELLNDFVGEVEHLHTGQTYQWENIYIDQLKNINVTDLQNPDKYLLLVQTGDEVLDAKKAIEFFTESPRIIQQGGSHGFENFADMIPEIIEFSNQ